jgi:hypothetical protein
MFVYIDSMYCCRYNEWFELSIKTSHTSKDIRTVSLNFMHLDWTPNNQPEKNPQFFRVTTMANTALSATDSQITYFLIPLSPFIFSEPLAQSSYSDILLITDVNRRVHTDLRPHTATKQSVTITDHICDNTRSMFTCNFQVSLCRS